MDPNKSCRDAARGTPISTLKLEVSEFAVLTVARYYFATFAGIANNGWLDAITTSLNAFGHDEGPHASVAILSAVQTMPCARMSMFHFNSATCPQCSVFVSNHEKAFLHTIRNLGRGEEEAAAAYAFLLCEGNDTKAFLQASKVVAEVCGLTRRCYERSEAMASRITLVEAPSGEGLR